MNVSGPTLKHACIAAALLYLGACAGAVVDAPPVPDTSRATGSVFEYIAAQERLRADIEDGVIGNLREYEKQAIFHNQDVLFRLLTGVEDVGELPEADKIAILNAQEAINGILSGNAGDAAECQRETLVGTHRPELVCLTPRQRQEQSEAARNALRQIQRAIMPRTGG